MCVSLWQHIIALKRFLSFSSLILLTLTSLRGNGNAKHGCQINILPYLISFFFLHMFLIKKRNHNRTRSTSDSKVKLVNNNVKQSERTVDAIVNVAGKGELVQYRCLTSNV